MMVRHRTLLERNAMAAKDNGQWLRELIEGAGLTQAEALRRFNLRQARPLTLGQWKAYLANIDSARRSPCPAKVLARAAKLFGMGS
jgi:hypothetical protein